MERTVDGSEVVASKGDSHDHRAYATFDRPRRRGLADGPRSEGGQDVCVRGRRRRQHADRLRRGAAFDIGAAWACGRREWACPAVVQYLQPRDDSRHASARRRRHRRDRCRSPRLTRSPLALGSLSLRGPGGAPVRTPWLVGPRAKAGLGEIRSPDKVRDQDLGPRLLHGRFHPAIAGMTEAEVDPAAAGRQIETRDRP